jgi:glycosyltransferase involved in cell wall biosynthesis
METDTIDTYNPVITMKVSILIPAHNEERQIADALHNLENQSYHDFEVIVIDNASTDRTTEIVNEFMKASSVKYPLTLVHESKKGTMWACEHGRLSATGDIIVRMDADCLPRPDWLRNGLHYFNDPQVSAVSGPYEYYDGPLWFKVVTSIIQKGLYTLTNYFLRFLKTGGVMIGGNSFMRASALAQAGGFNTDLVFYGDDTDTAKRLAHQGKVIFSPSVVLPSSARRFAHEGYLHTVAEYLYYFIRITLRKNPSV